MADGHEISAAASRHARLGAGVALAAAVAAVIAAVATAVAQFPAGLTVLACLVVAAGAAWWGLLRTGALRVAWLVVAAAAAAAAVVLLITEGQLLGDALVAGFLLLAVAGAGAAFTPHAVLPAADPPRRAVLFYNPKSGGGKAERFHLADEARARGVEPIELRRGDDLEQLAHDAVARGADALGVAGGDGSQAIVAAVAAEHGLPYVCIPAGTRNHFALDLGVDRDDVVGAMDAFVSARERVVDLAEVNGRVFVNNVSLGVYAEAVQKEEYRDAKLRTLAATMPALRGPNGRRLDLEWTDGDGQTHRSADVILVSNDPYRLGRALGSGTRPSLERGVLGVAALCEAANGRHAHGRLLSWSAPSFEVGSGSPVAAGIDGEAVTLDPPLRFRTRPRALRVRIAERHPGASPSALIPAGPVAGVRALARTLVKG